MRTITLIIIHCSAVRPDLNPLKDCPCIKDVAKEYADLQPK